MKYLSRACLGMAVALSAIPATAQAEDLGSGFTLSGEATVVSDYRFRGFTQSGEEAAIQGGFSVSHESGLYLGTWGSSINFANGTELDIYGGFSKEVTPGLTADIGATLYLYPGGGSGTSVIEPYFSLSGDVGPASLTAGVAWAPGGQTALGDDSGVYLYTDASFALGDSPFSLDGHIGYAKSDSFLGGPDGEVFDYSIGVSASYKALTASVSYVNTDVKRSLGKEALGADGAVIFTLGVSF